MATKGTARRTGKRNGRRQHHDELMLRVPYDLDQQTWD